MKDISVPSFGYISSPDALFNLIANEAMPNGNLSIRGVARMADVNDSAIIRGADFHSQKLAEILTGQGFTGADLTANGFPPVAVILVLEYFAYESKAKAPGAKSLMRLFGAIGLKTVLTKLAEHHKPQSAPVSQFIEPEVISAELEAIKFFTGNGDLRLAQLAKVHLGNRYLASQQKLLKPVDLPQYEGVIDVAIRLGFNVPSNYEGALGTHVAKYFKHLAIGHDKRYSAASAQTIGANMYPVKHPDIEKSVLDYCVSKAFYRREMNWLS